MIIKGGIGGGAVTFSTAIWWSSIATWISLVPCFLPVAKGFMDIVRRSTKDFDEARTPFGWTDISKTVLGKRSLNIGILDGAAIGSILGLIAALLVRELMSKGAML